MKTVTFNVEGMSCCHCEHRVCKNLLKMAGVKASAASYKEGRVTVKFDENLVKEQDVTRVINESGYTVK
jgi:copper chaperone CopZ